VNDDMLTPQSLSVEVPRRDQITSISGAVQRRPIVMVLGMHRSGTSLCAHILGALGVDMADDVGTNGGNARGGWERREIVEFHDRILSRFNRDYLGRFHDFPLPVAWWADPHVAAIRREMLGFLERRMGEEYFGFKDPRTVRLMPVWHQILRELKLAPKIVLCLRNPAQVARSLTARDEIDLDIAEYRWFAYTADFFRYTQGLDYCTVEYETWFEDPSINVGRLQNFLDLHWEQSELDRELAISGIVDQSLRHDDCNNREAGQPLVRSLYKLARRADHDAAVREQLQSIVSQFVSFQQFEKPFHRAFESLANASAGSSAIGQTAGNAAPRTLSDIFLHHSDYLSDKWSQFLPIYDIELQSLVARGRPLRLLEIGVQNGGSLQIWYKYLPEGSQIYGIDIDEKCRDLTFPKDVRMLIGDAGNPAVLAEILGKQTFDIIIDDGSHHPKDVVSAFETLLPRLTPGGKYFIEDLHTSYWSSHEGGLRREGTAIEYLKKVVDALNFDHFPTSNENGINERFSLSELNSEVSRVAFYDSIAVVVKYPRRKTSRFPRVLSGTKMGVTGADIFIDLIAATPDEFTFASGTADTFTTAATKKALDLSQEVRQLRAEVEQRAATEAALRAEVEQRAATEAALRAEVEQRAASEATLRAEVEQRAASEAALRAEVEQRAASEAALRAEVGTLQSVLAHVEQAGIEASAVAETMWTEIGSLRGALARAERERAVAAEAMQTEVAALRGGLTQSEREAQLRTASEAALQSEIVGLRTRLTTSERGARERAETVMALQGEIAALQETLAAARQVGRSAIAALQIGSATPTKIDRQRRWRLPLLRFLGAGASF
jgi:SAM-dependent methyltransferase